jgi:hypothetical protein
MSAARYSAVRARQAIRRVAPRHLEGDKLHIFEEESQLYRESPEAGVYEVDYGHADGMGTCRDRWGRLVPWNERSLPARQADPSGRWDPRAWVSSARTSGKTVACLAHPRQQSYFHWLFDVMPRYALLAGSGLRPDAIYVDQSLAFQRALWEMLGAGVPVIDAGSRPRIRAEPLFVPSAPSTSGVMPPWVCDWLRSTFLPAAPRPGPRRIYVSRKHSGAGSVRNDQEVERVLHAHGFACVLAEDLTVAQQIETFHDAEVVVGPHGAGLSNIVFAPPGCRLVEVFAAGHVNVCYWTLACQVALDYAFILGEAVAGKGSAGRPDIHMDLKKLDRVLEPALQPTALPHMGTPRGRSPVQAELR